MRQLLFLCLLILSANLYSQILGASDKIGFPQLSEQAEISVITCGPGEAVYEAFGHSAFRIRDPKLGIDRVYNYGIFDFNTPNYYLKFAQGNLLYLLGSGDFFFFIKSYQYQNRWVKAQVLDISSREVQACFDYLENNALPKNRAYLYDYFFDNCSTRLYDVINAILGEQLQLPALFEENPKTHRQLIQPYLTDQSWGDFGIDIALGSVIDRGVTMKEFLFLPENVLTFFDDLKIKKDGITKNIVKRTEVILKDTNRKTTDTYLTPFMLFAIIGLIVVVITRKNIKSHLRTKWLDFTLFFSFGLMGLVLTFISFATNHASAANNFNILWAFTPNLVVSFVLLKSKLPKWFSYYLLFLLILIGVVCILWIFKVQIFSNALLPILIFLSVRYVYLYKLGRTVES